MTLSRASKLQKFCFKMAFYMLAILKIGLFSVAYGLRNQNEILSEKRAMTFDFKTCSWAKVASVH